MELTFIFLLFFFFFIPSTSKVVNIGFLFDDFKLEIIAKTEIESINLNLQNNIFLNYTWHKVLPDSKQMFREICSNIISNNIFVIVTADSKTSAPQIVSCFGSLYNIPIIGLQTRNIEFSDKNLHPMFLRMVPSYVEQVQVWLQIMKEFSWTKIIVLTSDDKESQTYYIQFATRAYKSNIVIENSLVFPSGTINVFPYMNLLNGTQSRVFYVICSAFDAKNVFESAKKLQLTGEGHIWLTNEETLDENILKYVPQGTLSIRLSTNFQKEVYLKDTISVIMNALNKMEKLNTSPPSSCSEPLGNWITGKKFYKTLVNTSLVGYTGMVNFDWYGDRKNSKYEITNIYDKSTLINVGCVTGSNVTINVSKIVWPGNQTQIPKSLVISRNLKVVSIESNPFVIIKEMHPSNSCSNYNDGSYYVLCTGPTLYDKDKKDHCCQGYCIDLLKRLSERLNITYSLHLVDDGNFGSLTRENGSNFKRWNGIIGEIVEGKADIAVASLTINNERAQYIEFSKPYKYQGISILIKKTMPVDDLLSFLRPFKPELWWLVLLSVHVVAVVLYLLDRFSPFGEKDSDNKHPLDLFSTMWFAWGVLINSGVGEGIPRSFSARILAMVWAGFSMIIIASYTANLAAFLVLDKPKNKIEGINDPVLRNPSSSFKYGTVKDSSVEAYFRRQVEMSSMYNFMKNYNVQYESEGISKVKNGELDAFIWDSPVLYHETSKDCNLLTVGDQFGRSGYGIGVPKDSPWSDDISLSILYLQERGIMEELETRWINFGTCDSIDDMNKPTTLELSHMLGVFIMVAVGIGGGLIIVIFEVLYYKYRGWKEKQKNVLKKSTQHWQKHVEENKKNRILTKQYISSSQTPKIANSMVCTNNGFEK
nr:glutamate receptor ionotropic, NMDA 1 [Hydra vulgaris]